ncbi:MAG: DUF2225 domain-containing protein [Lachnospiraceae bacterium]|nr:DUF2225 domain-containing protein [Lachnospiraceae bacterium]
MRGQLPGSPPPSKESDKKGISSSVEMEYLLDKSHTCPVCHRVFTAKTVLSKKAESNGLDIDLMPRFKNVDLLKYRVVECPSCGYADLDQSFEKINPREASSLKEKALKNDKDAPSEAFVREYADAYRYYKSALRCCLVRGCRSSKRGQTAINAAWLLRSWREKLKWDGYVISDTDPMTMDEERKLIKYALRNFKDAELNEEFPISGMDEPTFDYFMAALCYNQDEIDNAGKYVLRALSNRALKPLLRPMAEDLRDMIKERRHQA